MSEYFENLKNVTLPLLIAQGYAVVEIQPQYDDGRIEVEKNGIKYVIKSWTYPKNTYHISTCFGRGKLREGDIWIDNEFLSQDERNLLHFDTKAKEKNLVKRLEVLTAIAEPLYLKATQAYQKSVEHENQHADALRKLATQATAHGVDAVVQPKSRWATYPEKILIKAGGSLGTITATSAPIRFHLELIELTHPQIEAVIIALGKVEQ